MLIYLSPEFDCHPDLLVILRRALFARLRIYAFRWRATNAQRHDND
jgi:hypothetical protein